jgi:hypothetical protein
MCQSLRSGQEANLEETQTTGSVSHHVLLRDGHKSSSGYLIIFILPDSWV